MKNMTFLALQGPDGTTADLAPIADAAQAHAGRLCVMHIGPVPLLSYPMMTSPYGIPAMPEGWLAKQTKMATDLSAKQEETRTFLVKAGLTGEVSTLCIEPSAMHDLTALRALFADIAIVQDTLRAEEAAFHNIIYGLLFQSPAPVMLNVTADSKALDPETVMIAWNSSVPAARAVRGALPLLKHAKEVIIASFDADPSRWADGDNPGADLAMWLSHHGCNVTVEEYVSGRKSVPNAMLARAQEHAADLLVMGSYGRSRWNERFFGGTTESMIAQTELPVLLAH